MTDPIDERTHERLCAWLMGELAADEARELEELCASSPALEAERARLAATMSLVQDTFSEEPALSDAAMARVMAAAGQPETPIVQLSWWRQPALRAAAAVTALIGGVLGVLSIEGVGPSATSDASVAVAETAVEGQASVEAGPTLGEPARVQEEAKLLRESEEALVAESAPGAEAGDAARLGQGLDVLGALGYAGGGAAPPTIGSPAAGVPESAGEGSPPPVEPGFGGKSREGRREYRGPGDSTPPSHTGPITSGPVGPASPGPARLAAPKVGSEATRGRAAMGATGLWFAERDDLGLDGELYAFGLGRESATGRDDFFLGPGGGRAVDPGGAELSEADLEALAERYADDVLRRCAPLPSERPRDMYFRFYGDNPFEYAPQDPRSTFSVDVDTASYALARAYLDRGVLPEKAQIRTEEFVNYFAPDLAAPAEGDFAIHTELAPSRFGGAEGRYLLRVGLRGREVPAEERPPMALTFVVDTSGSMREDGRLELVKHALRLLLTQLDARDRISLVAFSNEPRLVLPMTPATQRAVIEAALHPLSPDGGTNAEAGLKLGYEVARTAVDPKVTSRVVFLSDGVANIGQTDQDVLAAETKAHREQGIYLNTIGVGLDNHNDVFLERLADLGDGVCDYVDSPRTAKRALVDRFTGALVPIASDVKVQVVFDPSAVARYRLLGYENRAIADADFENDEVDAGEVGSGHQVVALYELELAPVVETSEAAPDGEAPKVEPSALGTVRLRWKEPKRTGQHPLEVQVLTAEASVAMADAVPSFAEATPGYRRSALVAQFAELLRRSSHARTDSVQELLAEAASLASVLADEDFTEFVGLVRRAEPLLVAERLRELQDELGMTIDEYRRLAYNRALLAELGELEKQVDLVEEIRKANEEIEGRIRDLIRERLQDR